MGIGLMQRRARLDEWEDEIEEESEEDDGSEDEEGNEEESGEEEGSDEEEVSRDSDEGPPLATHKDHRDRAT
ncbi:hypothetical protein PJP13_29790, partial [Mycobacterium kansasii]